MPQRQQRTNNARGTLPIRTDYGSPGLPWTVVSVVGAVITIAVTAPPSGLSINGIPHFRRSDNGQIPIGVVESAGIFAFTFGTPLPATGQVIYPCKDPYVRGPQGQYMNADVVELSVLNPPVPTVEQDWAYNSTIGSTIVLDIAAPLPGIVLLGPEMFDINAHSLNCIAARSDGAQVFLDFGGIPTSGDVITVSPVGLTGGDAGVTVMKARSAVIP